MGIKSRILLMLLSDFEKYCISEKKAWEQVRHKNQFFSGPLGYLSGKTIF
jgi:hypothetical protein